MSFSWQGQMHPMCLHGGNIENSVCQNVFNTKAVTYNV